MGVKRGANIDFLSFCVLRPAEIFTETEIEYFLKIYCRTQFQDHKLMQAPISEVSLTFSSVLCVVVK
jgi:hypothetical protein